MGVAMAKFTLTPDEAEEARHLQSELAQVKEKIELAMRRAAPSQPLSDEAKRELAEYARQEGLASKRLKEILGG
jgi:hypothetical protein